VNNPVEQGWLSSGHNSGCGSTSAGCERHDGSCRYSFLGKAWDVRRRLGISVIIGVVVVIVLMLIVSE
jgi:hypothetical protein